MIRVHTLGTALIEVGSTQITPVSTRKFALMLYLSAESERRVSREALQELIFPDQTEECTPLTARAGLSASASECAA